MTSSLGRVNLVEAYKGILCQYAIFRYVKYRICLCSPSVGFNTTWIVHCKNTINLYNLYWISYFEIQYIRDQKLENEILYLREDWHVKLFLFQLFLPTQ